MPLPWGETMVGGDGSLDDPAGSGDAANGTRDQARDGPGDGDGPGVPDDVAVRLVRALDRAPGAFVTLIDADMRSRWLSRSATWITGTDPVARPGRDAFERIHPDDAKRLTHGMRQLRAAPADDTPGDAPGDGPGSGRPGVPVIEPLRYRIRRPDDTWITVESIVHNLLDDPVVRGLLVIGRPVGGSLDGVGHVVDLLTADAVLPEVLGACADLVPHYLGPAAVVGMIDGSPVVGTRPGSAAERLVTDERWWRRTVADGRPHTPTEFAGIADDLAERARAEGFRTAWALPLTDPSSGDAVGAVVVWVRIAVELNIATEDGLRQAMRLATLVIGERRQERALRREAVTDPLTGVGNRSALRRRLDGVTEPVTAAIVDLDGFKPVNDTYGHDTGDAVLRVVAERIVGAVREDDLVVRFGGDEFAVVFGAGPRSAGSAGGGGSGGAAGDPAEPLSASADRIVDAIEAPIALDDGPTLSVGASLGIATASAADVIHLADASLYEAKARKRREPKPDPDDLAPTDDLARADDLG
jgi:GGDEF domain-containing protein